LRLTLIETEGSWNARFFGTDGGSGSGVSWLPLERKTLATVIGRGKGGRRMEEGEWRKENGGARMEEGGVRMEEGGVRRGREKVMVRK